MPFIDHLDDLHETQLVEFKEAASGFPQDVWETYSAMANTEGGEIVLGVCEDTSTNTFSVVGVSNPDSMILAFWNGVRDAQKVERDIMLRDGVYPIDVDGKHLVIIRVPRAER